MQLTPLCLLLPIVWFVCVFSPAAGIRVSPGETEFNLYDSVSLSCEDHVNSTDWRVKRSTKNGGIKTCLSGWGSIELGSQCILKNIYPSDIGLYWCESEDNVQSNILNLTIIGGRYFLIDISVDQLEPTFFLFSENATKPVNTTSECGTATDSSAPCSLSVFQMLRHLVVGAPYLLSTVLLGLIYRDKRTAAQTNTKRSGSHDVIMEIEV